MTLHDLPGLKIITRKQNNRKHLSSQASTDGGFSGVLPPISESLCLHIITVKNDIFISSVVCLSTRGNRFDNDG